MTRDRLFAENRADIEAFVFDDRVANVFADMVRRSVPGYATVVAMTGVLAAEHAVPGSDCYDLGCSLGASTLAMRAHLPPNCRIVAVDNAPAMLERLEASVSDLPGDNEVAQVKPVQADIRDITIRDASVVVLNFTLQFLPTGEREELIARIHEGLRPGGALILSEKIKAARAEEDQWLQALHTTFKRANGYSDLEISRKRAALERVLVPETLTHHETRLQGAGFNRVLCWMRCLNFASFLAVK